MAKPDPCISVFTHVCVREDGRLGVGSTSTCDHGPCHLGTFPPPSDPRSKNVQWAQRFPVKWLEDQPDLVATPDVALIPSHPGGVMEANMGHLLWDAFTLEVMIARRANISVVLGDGHDAEVRTNLVHALRRRLFGDAEFRPRGTGCFSKVYSYSWSCDRHLHQYHLTANDTREFETVETLRRLAAYNETARKNLVIYGRTDTGRRRLLNVSTHFARLEANFGERCERLVPSVSAGPLQHISQRGPQSTDSVIAIPCAGGASFCGTTSGKLTRRSTSSSTSCGTQSGSLHPMARSLPSGVSS